MAAWGTAQSNEESVPATGPRRSSVPGRWIWVFPLLLVLIAIFGRSIYPDPSVRNILLYFVTGMFVGTLWLWFVFRSSCSAAMRRGGLVTGIVLLIALPLLLRVEKTSGSLGLTLAWRWSPRPDQLLTAPGVIGSGDRVEMRQTTPHDFPQFLGPDRSSRVHGVRLNPDWANHPPRELWRRRIGAGWSAFSVVHGNAVTLEQRGEQELVTCYDVESGVERWAYGTRTRHETTLGYVGPRSTPTIVDGRVYVLGATGILLCLDGSDGQRIWVRDTFQDFGMDQASAESAVAWGRASSPLVHAGRVIIPVGGRDGGQMFGLVAFDANTGETLWTSGEFQAAYASPTIAKLQGQEQILCVYQNYAAGHDPQDGRILWQHPWPGMSNANANCSQPVVVDQEHVLLSKGYGVGAELIRLDKAESQWSVQSVWRNRRALKTKFSNVALKDGFAYGLDDGILCCLEVATGKLKWKKGRYGYGQILMAGDLLIVVGEQGSLSLVEAQPERFVERTRIQALHDQTWNNPCLYGDRLLLRNSQEAVCYALATLPTEEG